MKMNIVSTLLWVLVVFVSYNFLVIARLRFGVKKLRKLNESRKDFSKEILTPEQVWSKIRRSWRSWIQQLEDAGYHRLVSYTSLTAQQWIGENYSECYRSPDGLILASTEGYVVRRRFWTVVPVPFARLTGELILSQVLETEFRNGVILNTHNMQADVPNTPPDFRSNWLKGERNFSVMLESHRKLSDEISTKEHTAPVSFSDADSYFEYCKRVKAMLTRQPYVNVEKFVNKLSQGSEAMRQLVDPEE